MELQPERKGRSYPQRLGEKLKRIRQNGGLSQGKMLLIVNPDERTAHNRARVSQYERMKRVPSLIETHNYAQYAGVPVEVLIDDALDLPISIRRKKPPRKKENSTARVKEKEVGKSHTDDLRSKPLIKDQDGHNQVASPSEMSAVETTEDAAKDETVNANETSETETEAGKYHANLLAFPLIIEKHLLTENLCLELSAETLDRLGDLFLEIMRELPSHLRFSLTISDVINFCINTILTNHNDYQKNSLVMYKTRRLIEDSGDQKLNAENAEKVEMNI